MKRLNWRALVVFSEALVAVVFFASISFTNSELFISYGRDLRNIDSYCHNVIKNYSNILPPKECLSFFYKTFDDPVSVFTAGLFLFTFVLAAATAVLILVTLFGISEQAENTKRLFTLDQRPWLKATICVADPVFSFNSRSTNIRVNVIVENIGKSHAFEAAIPSYFVIQHFQARPDLKSLRDSSNIKPKNTEFILIRDKHRADVRDAFLRGSTTIHAGERLVIRGILQIARDSIEKMWSMPGTYYNLAFISIPYRGFFLPGEWYETTVVTRFQYGFMGSQSIPRNQKDLDQINAVHDLVFKQQDAGEMAENILDIGFVTIGNLSVTT